jgi:hypothetical protein
MMDQWDRDIITKIFNSRPCGVCGKLGWCGDREISVELAELGAVAPRKPQTSEEIHPITGKRNFTRHSRPA